ncbi:fatty acid desaturase family protein [Solicola gregarius]|uniref:Acyl-CoA desaturase n=1 Tax=Solicola gregarius TaxID=2908642 RepID=A0AA46YK15_9ACTN|nr:acyl-CoA desaturase [Solicola gregarius]UYM03553.1 acyl-CoA desaturase [Solicola gregarius]
MDTQERHVSLYTNLAHAVRESGLLRRRYAYYWSRITLAVLAFGLIWAGVFMIGNSWFQLILAVALGAVITQFGFLGHDGAHRQIFDSAAWNEWTSRVLGGVFAGLSHGWWRAKHNRHHAAPNQEGKDPDIAPGALAFTRDVADSRQTGFAGWFVRRQGWLFFPLLTLEGLNLHVASVRTVLQPGAIKHQRVEAALVLSRLALYVVVLLMVLPLGKAAAFFALQMAVFGLCLGGSFAPNHKGMPIVPPTARIDFLRRQVLMSRNIRGGPVVDFAMGGLNYQIEHHLFPSMPRPNLKHVQPLVRSYCEDHGISYTEVGLLHSYRIVVDYLNNVGLRARGPFDCPLAQQLRN